MAQIDRLRVALAPLIALTLGAGIGAAVRDSHHHALNSTGTKTAQSSQSSGSSAQDQALEYARQHAFAFEDPPSTSGAVDRWDPCVPVHYRVHIAAPVPDRAAAIEAIDAAFRQVAVATGMQFVDDGTTSELPSDTRKDVRRVGSGWQWAPVLVAVVPHMEFTRSADSSDAVAYTDPDIYTSDDETVSQIVSAEIVVDSGEISYQGPGDPEGLEPTMLHEIGHLVGLGHVRQSGEIMQPDGGGVVGLGPGDLAGLQYLGASAGCIVQPVLPRDSSDYPG